MFKGKKDNVKRPLTRFLGSPNWLASALVDGPIWIFCFSQFQHIFFQRIIAEIARCQRQDFTHLLLECPASETLWRAIFGTTFSVFDLSSKIWGVARLLSLHGIPPRPQPLEGVGYHHHRTPMILVCDPITPPPPSRKARCFSGYLTGKWN